MQLFDSSPAQRAKVWNALDSVLVQKKAVTQVLNDEKGRRRDSQILYLNQCVDAGTGRISSELGLDEAACNRSMFPHRHPMPL